MALSREDKKDVASHFGKKAANAVSKATRDHGNPDWALGGSHAPSSGWGAHKDKTGKRSASGYDKAFKKRTKSSTSHINEERKRQGYKAKKFDRATKGMYDFFDKYD